MIEETMAASRLGALMLAGLAAMSVAAADGLIDQAEELESEWVAVEGAYDGKPLTKTELTEVNSELRRQGKLSCRGVLFILPVLLSKGNPPPFLNAGYAGVFRPEKSPREFHLLRFFGAKGTTYPGIYELRGDTLRVCFNLEPWYSPDGPPLRRTPTAFAAEKGSGLTLLTLRRGKR
jgi:uncharacterized protein (TIGR03067 family)